MQLAARVSTPLVCPDRLTVLFISRNSFRVKAPSQGLSSTFEFVLLFLKMSYSGHEVLFFESTVQSFHNMVSHAPVRSSSPHCAALAAAPPRSSACTSTVAAPALEDSSSATCSGVPSSCRSRAPRRGACDIACQSVRPCSPCAGPQAALNLSAHCSDSCELWFSDGGKRGRYRRARRERKGLRDGRATSAPSTPHS